MGYVKRDGAGKTVEYRSHMADGLTEVADDNAELVKLNNEMPKRLGLAELMDRLTAAELTQLEKLKPRDWLPFAMHLNGFAVDDAKLVRISNALGVDPVVWLARPPQS